MEPKESDQKPIARNDPEHFRHELEFLDGASHLVDTLRKYKQPVRKMSTFEIPALGRKYFNYPPSLDKKYGEVDYESVVVTIVKEGDESSTKIELLTGSKRVFMSRDPVVSEEPSDYIIDELSTAETPVTPIAKVPNAEINDFLYSITLRGEDPARKRFMGVPSPDERVIGEEMRDALESRAVLTSTDYTFELDGQSFWFTIEGTVGDEKVVMFSMRYKDYDMQSFVVDIDTSKSLAINFTRLDANGSSSQFLPTKEDYLTAMRVMREVANGIVRPIEGKHVASARVDELEDADIARIQGI